MGMFSDSVLNLPRIVMYGRKRMLVEQHRGLYSYETSCIRIRIADGLLIISGSNLVISHFGTEDLCICGDIRTLSLEDRT